MGRRNGAGERTYDVESWPDSLGPGFRVMSQREIEARQKQERVVSARLALRFGPDSDIAQMLGLAAPALVTGVAA